MTRRTEQSSFAGSRHHRGVGHPTSSFGRKDLWSALLSRLGTRKSETPYRFYLLSVWLFILICLGGSSNPDAPTLLLVRPLSVFITGLGFVTLSMADVKRLKEVFIFVTAVMALIGVHLVPLPPALWSILPGRQIIVDIDKAVGLWGTWRPISMSPPWTWNAFWFMFGPLSVLVHAAQLPVDKVRSLGLSALLAGGLSALIGAAQLAGDPHGPFFFYRFTHPGMAVGLFANRNHQAAFLACMMPLGSMWLRRHPLRLMFDQSQSRKVQITPVALVLLVAVLVASVLATGSRSGLLLVVFSVIFSPLVFPMAKIGGGFGAMPIVQRSTVITWSVFSALVGLGVTAIALQNGRALSIDRFITLDPLEDMRTKILPTVYKMVRLYAPVGSGIGTFEPVYQISEPDDLLIPSHVNHVHNDWLEVVVTAGIPGILLLCCAFAGWVRGLMICARLHNREERPDSDLAIMGLLGSLLLGVASFSDYPLRTPAVACLGMLLMLWISLGLCKSDDHSLSQTKDLGRAGGKEAAMEV